MSEHVLMRLRHLARRLLWVHLAAGAGWGIVAALVLMLGGAWLDLLWEMPAALRAACGGAALATLLGVLVSAGGLARRRGRAEVLAGRLDAAAHAGGQIRAGADLALAPTAQPTLTAGLAAMAIQHAGELAAPIPAARVVPLRPVGRALAVLGTLAGLVTLLAIGLPRLAEAQWWRFLDPFGDHPPYSRVLFQVQPGDVTVLYGGSVEIRATTDGAPVERLDLVLHADGAADPETLPMFPSATGEWYTTIASVTAPGRYHVRAHAGRSGWFRIRLLTVPRLEEVVFRVTPPAYTNRPASEGPLPQGGLAGLPGTRIEVRVRSNRPLAGGVLELTDATTLALAPVGINEVSGTFEIRKSGKVSIRVTDTDGQSSTDPFVAPIAVLSDERPAIRLVEPPAISFATPDVALPVVLAAEDDYGLTRVQLFRSLNDSRALPLDWTLPKPAPTRWSTMTLLPLSTYGLAPGDEIKLFARAEDNDPAGPNGAESAVVVVRIISQEEYEKLARAREGMEMFLSKYRAARRRAETLADEVERLRKKTKQQAGDTADNELADELSKLADRLREEAEAIRKAAERNLPYDLDRALSPHLQRMAQRLHDLSASSRKLAGSGLSRAQLEKALERLKHDLEEQQQELEQEAIEPLEHLALILPVLQDAARFVELAQHQKDLAERLRPLKDRDKVEPGLKGRLRDLEVEQQQLRAALQRLLEDIEDHAGQLPEDPKLDELRKEASDFARDVRASGAGEAMNDAERGLAEQSGSRGHAGARQAADILDKFVKRCAGGMAGQGRMCLRFQPKLVRGLGQTVEQLLADMGLSGNGQGAGGYSTQRNSLENLGLYGNLPALESAKDSRSAHGSRSAQARGTSARGADTNRPDGTTGTTPTEAQGASDATVPLSYRRRVAEYFQRIADETGGR